VNQSPEIKDLAEALAKAQGQMEKLKTDEKASVVTQKGNFSYTYASLANVIECSRKALAENQLVIVQSVEGGPETVTVTSRLMHSSGQWLESALTLKATKPDIQGLGSAATYGRRYSLMALLGVAPEDDDGQAACTPPPHHQQQPVKQTKPVQTQKTEKSAPVPPQVRQILAIQMEHQLSNDEVLQIGGLETLRGSTEAQLNEALNRLDFHLKEVKQA